MTISARLLTSVPHDTQARFTRLAGSRGVSSSRLLAALVEAALMQNPLPEKAGKVQTKEKKKRGDDDEPLPAKYTVRLQEPDAETLHLRAERRGLTPSGYAGQVVLAHLRAAPPMLDSDFKHLHRVVNELAGVRDALVQMSARKDLAQHYDTLVGAAVQKVLQLLTNIRAEVKATLVADSKAWETPGV